MTARERFRLRLQRDEAQRRGYKSLILGAKATSSLHKALVDVQTPSGWKEIELTSFRRPMVIVDVEPVPGSLSPCYTWALSLEDRTIKIKMPYHYQRQHLPPPKPIDDEDRYYYTSIGQAQRERRIKA